jgi:signal transduction histidine kinase
MVHSTLQNIQAALVTSNFMLARLSELVALVSDPQIIAQFTDDQRDDLSHIQRSLAHVENSVTGFEHWLQTRDIDENNTQSYQLSNFTFNIRTPLHTIIGFSKILIEDLDGILPNEHHHQLERIQRAAAVLLGLWIEMIDLSDIEEFRA